MTIFEMLNTMDVPENRKDVTKIENVRWLLRNLYIRNQDNIYFLEVVRRLKEILKCIG